MGDSKGNSLRAEWVGHKYFSTIKQQFYDKWFKVFTINDRKRSDLIKYLLGSIRSLKFNNSQIFSGIISFIVCRRQPMQWDDCLGNCKITYVFLAVLVNVTNVFDNFLIGEVLERLFTSERQNFPQQNSVHPNVRLWCEFTLKTNIRTENCSIN